ncbi:unnamed protein product [Spirodela intermedia]|uniref:Uncharacterized protein n=1 Tax=Spirodela intermedia TaxID=51605 RepID=A0A7I8KUZ5_SPIIN|nr:unnamed protein product [Spirodela intermedia]
MKWVAESSPAAVTRQSGKTATLRLSGGCHPTERSWMEVGRCQGASSSGLRSKRRLFIASVPFSRVYDHSLPHSRLVTREWRTHASIGSSHSSPCSRLLPDYASDPLAGLAGRRVPPFCNIFILISFPLFISK